MIPQTQPIERPSLPISEPEARSSRQAKVVPATLARQTFRDLRERGLSEVEIMAFAGELLELVAQGVSSQGTDVVYLDV